MFKQSTVSLTHNQTIFQHILYFPFRLYSEMDVNAKETTLPLNLFLMSLFLWTGDLMDRCSFVQIIIRNLENPKKNRK